MRGACLPFAHGALAHSLARLPSLSDFLSLHPLQDRLYYCALESPPTQSEILVYNHRQKKVSVQYFTVDQELIYMNYSLDFGPLNLGQLYRFTIKLKNLLAEDQNNNNKNNRPVLLFYSSPETEQRANAIYLICAWQVLELKRTPEQAFLAFQTCLLDHEEEDDPSSTLLKSSSYRRRLNCSVPPPIPLTRIGKATVASLPPFHDANPFICTYDLTLKDCLEGLAKARQLDFFDWDAFNVEEYEFYERIKVRASGRGLLAGPTIAHFPFFFFHRMAI